MFIKSTQFWDSTHEAVSREDKRQKSRAAEGSTGREGVFSNVCISECFSSAASSDPHSVSYERIPWQGTARVFLNRSLPHKSVANR